MRTTVEYLDALRARHNLPSDYALSKLLNLTRSAVSSYRTGRTYFDDETAMRVAELLDLDPAHVLSIIAAERTKSEKVKKAWQRAAAATAALALAAVQVALTGSDGGALNLLAYLAALPFNSSIHYALFAALLTALWFSRTIVRHRIAGACLALILAGCATPRAGWDRTDAALGSAALAATVIDWGQTRTVAKHPELYQETNPIMGKHPSLRTVNTYFSSAIVGSALIAHALPGELRKGFLGGIAVWEIHITQNNLKIGVGCTF